MSDLFKPTKWISAISLLFFSWAAVVQITGDPDTIYWFLIYASVAVCSLVNLVFRPGKTFAPVPLLVAVAAIIWGAFLLPEFDLFLNGHVKNLFDESIKHKTEIEREVFGLLLVLLFSLFELFHCTTMNSEEAEQGQK